MARLSQEKINEIRQSVDIVDVIGEYLPLEKKGRNYIALCLSLIHIFGVVWMIFSVLANHVLAF